MTWVIARLVIIVVVLQFVALELNVSQLMTLLGTVIGWFIGEVVSAIIRQVRGRR